MRYSYEYKKMCVELYRQGLWPDTPDGLDKENFRKTIRSWVRIEENCGPEALRHKGTNKVWSQEEKFGLVSKVLAGHSIKNTAYAAGVNSGQLCHWVNRYKIDGYIGLANRKKGRPSKETSMKTQQAPRELNESEREELIRLREENEYIKAENEVIKKEIALREEKEAALLKAKKQQSSKNSEKRGSN